MLCHMPCISITKVCFSYFNLFDNMAQKTFLRFLVLLLCFTFVVSTVAGSLKKNEEDPSAIAVQDLQAQDLRDGDELFDVEGGILEFETADYKGPGANPGHDPKTPGKP
ncbi:hypothetical protein SO802_031837 [Lithocarpus litseifolius]|uniref:Uncharacterized protein n=1 Tax=Lithocarpus litseifolius TaxID=425828 RepID=A0AAW2BLQ1_9ROSI